METPIPITVELPVSSLLPQPNQLCTRTCRVYELDAFQKLTKELKVAACMISDIPPITDEASVVRRAGTLTGEDAPSQSNGCSSCQAGPFETRAQQTAHYKHHWHTYNLRRRLLGRPPLTFADFNSRDEDASSVSDSDSDPEDGTIKKVKEVPDLFIAATRHCRAYFTNGEGKVFSVYRCLLHHKKEWISGDGKGDKWVNACKKLTHETGWAVIMCAGGHFAAAIFRGESDVAVKHKALHSYVTRRSQGKSQGNRDSKGNHAPRSAGSSLRRYNQEQFAQHVQEVLTSWKEDLEPCSLILYRAVGPLNKACIFGTGSPLYRNDLRLRTLPFPTRRPSFKEVRRAHTILSTVEIYDTYDVFQRTFGLTSMPSNLTAERPTGRKVQKGSPQKTFDRAKSREKTPRPTPMAIISSEDEAPCYQQSNFPPNWAKALSNLKPKTKKIVGSESDEEIVLETSLIELNLKDTLKDFDDSLKKKGKKKPQKKNQKNNNQSVKTEAELEDEKKAKFYESVYKVEEKKGKLNKSNNVKNGPVKIPSSIRKMWESLAGDKTAFEDSIINWDDTVDLLESLNTSDPKDGNTILHKAAIAELPDIVTFLLEFGADPCCRNLLLQTPYCATSHQDTRIAFRLFQGLYPDKYQYSKANIPGPLTPDMIEQEKEKKINQKKIKKQKEKERQQEKVKSSKFLELSEKQKLRAVDENRCFTCGGLIPKVAFFYENFQFCHVKCLQRHRNARPLNLSTE